MRHKLSNVNETNLTGDCEVCGAGAKIRQRYGEQGGFRCYVKYMEQKGDKGREKRYFKTGHSRPQGAKRRLLEIQGYECSICHTSVGESAALDHSHKDGRVRGVLCHSCNVGLGYFKDNPESLRTAIEYLANPPGFSI